MLQTEQSKYICEGVKDINNNNQLPLQCFMEVLHSLQMTIKYYFTLSQWLFTSLTYLICLKVTDLTLTDLRKNEYEKLIWKLGSFCIAFSSLSFSMFPIFTSKFVLKVNWCWCWCIAKFFFWNSPVIWQIS